MGKEKDFKEVAAFDLWDKAAWSYSNIAEALGKTSKWVEKVIRIQWRKVQQDRLSNKGEV